MTTRRRVLSWGGLAAVAAPLVGAAPARAGHDEPIPPATLPGGAYDRYVAQLAAEGRFSGVVLLSHRGRTVLSRAYGMADAERGVRIDERTAFTLSSAGKPFNAIAILQLAQRGKLGLSDTVGAHLTGFAGDLAEGVTIHQLLTGASGTRIPDEDIERVFQSREEVHEYRAAWARQSELVGVPGLPDTVHNGASTIIPALIVEAVSGMTYWDYVEENVFRRCGMKGSGFFTRPQWLTDEHVAHPYMTVDGGGRVDALRHLDQGSSLAYMQGRNPGRAFIDAPGDGGFATAPDLVRFARALLDGTLLAGPWADVFLGPKLPQGPDSFGTYGPPAHIIGGQWHYQRAGANPGIGANWSIYPDTGWVAVTLSNCDGVPLELLEQETQAITGVGSEG